MFGFRYRLLSVGICLAAGALVAGAQAEEPKPMKYEWREIGNNHWQIKPEKADDFASLIKELKAKMATSEKPDVKAQGDSIKLMRVQTDPSVAGPAIFLLMLDPPSSLSYDSVKMMQETRR